MAISFDGETKIISLSLGTVSLSVHDLYSRWKDWVLLSDNSKYAPAFVSVGGDPIDAIAGTAVPLYAFLENGWTIRPQEASHTLAVIDGILLVSGGGDPFTDTLGAFIVRINYQQPVQAIGFDTGGGGGASPSDVADAVWAKPKATLNTPASAGSTLVNAETLAEEAKQAAEDAQALIFAAK